MASKSSSDRNSDSKSDPLNPEENEASELDDLTHAEFREIYQDSSVNLRFAKQQQWRAVLYFSVGAAAVAGYGEWTRWTDAKLANYFLVLVWIFSIATVCLLVSLQWWQAAENKKIVYVTSKWSSFANAARGRKSSFVSDLQRYGILVTMILYLELVTIAVTRIIWPHA
ncbi:MAG: hypothetical protein HOH65_06835 [Rhodospirillaceae bacterium]|jgi:hypothetical protein|nr:hypothetical protein [Rhodospirillaceae bacterium]